MSSLLLHSCCAPCSIVPLELLKNQDIDVTIFYYNPNIHPQTEYQLRLETLTLYAQQLDIPVQVGSYQTQVWEQEVAVFGGPYPLIKGSDDYENNNHLRQLRCTACYSIRFKQLAKTASEQGIQAISTTLSISPYQYLQAIQKTLAACALSYQLMPQFQDYRDYYAQATKQSRELGMYRQNYCGCRFSKIEAQIERDARKTSKKQDQVAG